MPLFHEVLLGNADVSQCSPSSIYNDVPLVGSGFGVSSYSNGFTSHALNNDHTQTSFFPMMGGMGGMGGMGTSASGQAVGATPGMPGQQPDPNAAKPIDPAIEISRINSNILLYRIGLIAGCLGIGMSTCLFVKSILQPVRKGSGGGDSDSDEEEEDDDDESDD